MITLDSLEDLGGVSHAFFTRRGGVSKGIHASLNCGPGSSDKTGNVEANRIRAIAAMGLAGAGLVTVRQVHSAIAVVVDGPWGETGAPKADGLVTKVRGLVLGVLTADCAPVLLADADAGIIGAAHAGWRGAKGGILEATLQAMVDLGADAGNIAAGIGPCIAAPSYEVGEDFSLEFLEDAPENRAFFSASDKEDHYLFDLPGYVAGRLESLGLMSIENVSRDTLAEGENFFSYRRATLNGEDDYGRNLSAIALIG